MNQVVKTVLLVTHPTRPEAISTANELTKLLTGKQINVFDGQGPKPDEQAL